MFPCLVQLVGVSSIVIHHSYNALSKESDVALLKLEKPLEFNQFVRPIDIWMTPLPLLVKCTITGWGSTRESKEVFDLSRRHRCSRWDLTFSILFLCHQVVLESTGCRK